jgi:hypothetical protein
LLLAVPLAAPRHPDRAPGTSAPRTAHRHRGRHTGTADCPDEPARTRRRCHTLGSMQGPSDGRGVVGRMVVRRRSAGRVSSVVWSCGRAVVWSRARGLTSPVVRQSPGATDPGPAVAQARSTPRT